MVDLPGIGEGDIPAFWMRCESTGHRRQNDGSGPPVVQLRPIGRLPVHWREPGAVVHVDLQVHRVGCRSAASLATPSSAAVQPGRLEAGRASRCGGPASVPVCRGALKRITVVEQPFQAGKLAGYGKCRLAGVGPDQAGQQDR